MASKSIKQECLEFLIDRVGYQRDYSSKSRKYQKYILGPDGARILLHLFNRPIYVGTCGAFRMGHTLEQSLSITDDIRRLLHIPAYGNSEQYYRQARMF